VLKAAGVLKQLSDWMGIFAERTGAKPQDLTSASIAFGLSRATTISSNQGR
jgi:hypothetical protein